MILEFHDPLKTNVESLRAEDCEWRKLFWKLENQGNKSEALSLS